MKKIKNLLLILAMVLVLGVITSCDGTNPATGNENTPTVEHTHNYKSEVVNPTCEKGGYTKHTCECGNTYNDTETSALGHTEVIDEGVEPSCINDGIGLSEGKHCSVCNKVLVAQETVKGSVEHNFGEWTIIKEATEDEEGSKKQVCSICGLENVQSIPLKEHVHSYTSNVVEPTCDMPGYTMHECTKCGECYIDNEVEPLGHDWLETTYTWSDDSSMVTAVRLCKNDNTHNETLSVEVTSEVVQEQTCTLPELTTYIASFEGTSFETQMKEAVTQEALGHLWWQEIMYTWNECDGGWEATATRVCGRDMSHNEVESVIATSVVVQEQTCKLPELTTYTASFEGLLFDTQIKENVKTKEPSDQKHNIIIRAAEDATCTTNGYTEGKYCDICLETFVEQEEIPAAGHSMNKGNCVNCEYTIINYYIKEDGLSYEVGFSFVEEESIVILSEYQGLPVTSIAGSAFAGNSSLVNIVIPNSIISIGEDAFYGCEHLNNIEIPTSVTSIGTGAFQCCSSLTSITIPNSVTKIEERTFSTCTSLTNIEIPTSITSIDSFAFQGCTNLNNVELHENLISIGEYAFSFCQTFTEVVIPNTVISIGEYAFFECNNLKSITLPFIGNTKDGIENTNFSYIFVGTLPPDIHMQKSLEEVTITNVTNIPDNAFAGCNLTSIEIPSSVTSIGESAFASSDITSINIPNGVTSIGDRAFNYCSNLKSISIPNSVTEMGERVFEYCINLEEIIISANITILKEGLLYNCTNLNGVLIPNNITKIDKWVFTNCENLEKVYYFGSKEEWENVDVDSSNDTYLNEETIYYYSESQPTEGNYWHYATDGVTPVIW